MIYEVLPKGAGAAITARELRDALTADTACTFSIADVEELAEFEILHGKRICVKHVEGVDLYFAPDLLGDELNYACDLAIKSRRAEVLADAVSRTAKLHKSILSELYEMKV